MVVTLMAVLWLFGKPVFAELVAFPEWIQFYNGTGNDADEAHLIVIDKEGNIIVSGDSQGAGTSHDYLTIKYSAAGVALWTNRYDGPANGPDGLTGLVLDGDDNVIVTGYSAATSPIRPVAVEHYATIKYSSGGVPLWTNRYVGPAEYDHAMAVAVDGNNNVILAGFSSDSDFPFFRFAAATVKYSSEGALLWSRRFTSSEATSGDAIAIDRSNNIIVVGSIQNVLGFADYWTIKYSDAGAALWTNRYNGPGSGHDVARAVALDGSGNVVVTGHSYSSPSYTNSDYLTIKYSSAGVPLWTNRYDGPAKANDLAYAIAIDADDNVIVTGESHNGTNRDYATVKYSSAGLPLSTNRYNGPANSDDVARSVAADAKGNIVVTGYSAGTEGHAAYATIQYSRTGQMLWAKRYTQGDPYNSFANDVAVDANGNVFVTGSSSAGGISDFATIKYSILPGDLIGIRHEGSSVVLRWTNATYSLHSAPEVTGPFSPISNASSPWTNPVSRARQFFQLMK